MTGSPDQRTVRRGGAVGVPRDGIACFYGLRYGQLSRPGSPRSAVAAADGQLKVEDLTEVPVFPQLPSRLESVMGPGIRDNPQEDEAFYLNVWAPEDAAGLPVLVFLHGGAWVSGGGAARWYRGERLAGEGLVVVTLNYRLGPAGHLDDDEPGSYHRPIEDILEALRWVQRHIADFGGDPDRVTLAGQSAGAWYAWALSTLPAAAGLFRRAALLSIPSIKPWTPVQRSAFTRAVLAARAREAASRHEPREALLRAGARVLPQAPREPGAIPPMYLPVWTEDPARPSSKFHVDALYLRVTRHEMSVFLPEIPPRFHRDGNDPGTSTRPDRHGAGAARSQPPGLATRPGRPRHARLLDRIRAVRQRDRRRGGARWLRRGPAQFRSMRRPCAAWRGALPRPALPVRKSRGLARCPDAGGLVGGRLRGPEPGAPRRSCRFRRWRPTRRPPHPGRG